MTRDERRAEARARVVASLAERIAPPPEPIPGGPPRYDDEWAAGVAWLDRCADADVWPDPATFRSACGKGSDR